MQLAASMERTSGRGLKPAPTKGIPSVLCLSGKAVSRQKLFSPTLTTGARNLCNLLILRSRFQKVFTTEPVASAAVSGEIRGGG
jgi:hypothetical protein